MSRRRRRSGISRIFCTRSARIPFAHSPPRRRCGRVRRRAAHAPLVPSTCRRRRWTCTSHSPRRRSEDTGSTASAAPATSPRKESAGYRSLSPGRSRRYPALCREPWPTSSRRPCCDTRRAPRSRRRHAPAPLHTRHPDSPDRPRSARSASCPPARCAPMSCPRRWTCTCRRRSRCRSACPPRPIRHRPYRVAKARRRWPRSSRSSARRTPASTPFPRPSSSRSLRPPTRNKTSARPPEPPRRKRRARRGTAQPSATTGH